MRRMWSCKPRYGIQGELSHYSIRLFYPDFTIFVKDKIMPGYTIDDVREKMAEMQSQGDKQASLCQ